MQRYYTFIVERHITFQLQKQVKYLYGQQNSVSNQIIFTTYHSLHRVQESDIHVDTIYFDEAHNSVQKNFYPATEYFSFNADRCYFFTATPKHSRTPEKAGMNHTKTYGNVICQIPAPRLVKQGYILPPKVEVYRSRILKKMSWLQTETMSKWLKRLTILTKTKY